MAAGGEGGKRGRERRGREQRGRGESERRWGFARRGGRWEFGAGAVGHRVVSERVKRWGGSLGSESPVVKGLEG